MNNIVTWIVEEVDSKSGEKREHPFTTYTEALDFYNDLKVTTENFISIQKSSKKLLLE